MSCKENTEITEEKELSKKDESKNIAKLSLSIYIFKCKGSYFFNTDTLLSHVT